MATNNNPWDPTVPVSFPDSYDYANVKIAFEHHSGVRFGRAEWSLDRASPFEPDLKPVRVIGYFIQANTALDEGWFRVDKSDFEMLLRRCKAERASQLYVTYMGGSRASAVFRPSDFDRSSRKSSDLMEPLDDETGLWLRVLEHREVAA